MMAMKDKLIELIDDCRSMEGHGMDLVERQADHLIANGVTVQGWVSVRYGLPKVGTEVLISAVGKRDGFVGETVVAISERYVFRILPSSEGTEEWRSPWRYFLTDYEITHWMPLPDPPKGE